MAENLNFNYLTSNQSYPDGIDSGNIYFKLVEDNNTNNQIYNQSHSIEIALDLGTQRYFLTPKIATEDINGLLSKSDKEKINALENTYVNKKNFKDENNVEIIISKEGSEPTGSFTFDDNNKLQLNINIPRDLIKGADGIKGDDGIDGITPIIKKQVLIESSSSIESPAASMNKDGDSYQLAIQLPDLKGADGTDGTPGQKGDPGITPSFRNLNVELDKNINTCESSISKVEDSNAYDIEIKLPKNQLIGPRGWQGANGNDATATIEIHTSDTFNSIDNIEVGPGIEPGSTALTLSGHYSPVIPEYSQDKPPAAENSLLIKQTANSDYNYVPLTPKNGFLEYNNGWIFNSIIPVGKGGTGQTSLASNQILLGNGINAIEEITNENGALYYDNSDNQHPAPRFGTLPVALGGTGKSSFTNNSIIAGSTNGLQEISNAAGAFYSENAEKTPQFGTLPTSLGGTGATTFSKNSVIVGGDNALTEVQNQSGAFLSDGGENAPKFGILPVKYGGVGSGTNNQSLTAAEARVNIGATHAILEKKANYESYILKLENVVTPVPTSEE